METGDKLSKLVPKRDDDTFIAEGQKFVDKQASITIDGLVDREKRKVLRDIKGKQAWHRKQYGDNFVPDYDPETGERIFGQHTGLQIKRKAEFEQAELEAQDALERSQREATPVVTPEQAHVPHPEEIEYLNTPLPKNTALLLKKLNIETKIQLTKAELNSVVSALMMCSEAQLTSIESNPKTPVVIRIIIKSLKMDLRLGSMEVVEKLWDRIFGKASQQVVHETQSGSILEGLIPGISGGPVSREAYILIRERIFNEDDKYIPPPYEIS